MTGARHHDAMLDELIVAARQVVGDHLGSVRWAVLSGSIITPRRTNGSDMDIVVMLGPDSSEVPHRRSLMWKGTPVELFVHDSITQARFLDRELVNRRPVLRRMIATGVPVIDVADELYAVAQTCRRELAAGPLALSRKERDQLRYLLTDLLDDAAHASAAELTAVSGVLWQESAKAFLDVRGHWRGTGKWLLRELSACDEDVAMRWVAAWGHVAETIELTRLVLAELGGELFDGYRVNA